jgi:cation diffusion facilitator family transporter
MSSKLKAASVSILVNVVLLISKIIVATLTGSIGLIAESAHSLFDLIASGLAYFGIKKAEQPSDSRHHYGHHKFENLSSLLQALLITGTACIVIFESYQKLLSPHVIENSEIGIILMIITIPVTFFTSRYLAKIAKKTGGSQALEADSAHFTTDVLGSIAVLLGLLIAKLGYTIGDPLAAMVVGLIMIYISIKLIKDSFVVFMDYSPDEATMKKINKAVKANKDIVNFHNLKARMAGNQIFVDLHIRLKKNMPVEKAHAISHELKRSIMKKVPQVNNVTIHIEPD